MSTKAATFAAFAALALSAWAQQGALDKIRAAGAITIGDAGRAIPLSYRDDKPQLVGFIAASRMTLQGKGPTHAL